jgi:hypothetical protein
MDDVRIFSKDGATARKVIFHMDQAIRSLHLNVQSAKTKILKGQEIHEALGDERIEKLKVLQDTITSATKSKNEKLRNRILQTLRQVAHERPKGGTGQKLLGSQKPLKEMSLRAYRMWINCHVRLGDPFYLPSLFRELQRNPDHRLTKTFVNSMRAFPRSTSYAKKVLKFIDSDLNIYHLQEAELLRGIRYCSRIEPKVRDRMVDVALHSSEYFYVRVQACHLLTRFELNKRDLDKLLRTFDSEADEMVLTALALPLGQLRDERNSDVVRTLVHHPNSRVALLGKHIRHVKNDFEYATQYINFVFEKNAEMRVCDHLGPLSYVAQSRDPKILFKLQTRIDQIGPLHPAMDIRDKLFQLGSECERNLQRISNR